MKESWVQLKNIVGKAGLPTTVQGVTLRAKSERWERRRVQGKGKVFEYNVASMPQALQHALISSEVAMNSNESRLPQIQNEDLYREEWDKTYFRLSNQERKNVTDFIAFFGVRGLMKVCTEEAMELVELPEELKSMACAIKNLPDTRIREIFNNLAGDERTAPLIEKPVNKAG